MRQKKKKKEKKKRERKEKAYFVVYFKINTLSVQLFIYSAVISLNTSNYKNTDVEHCMCNKMIKKCEMTGRGEGVGQSVRKCEMGGGGVLKFSKKKASSDI